MTTAVANVVAGGHRRRAWLLGATGLVLAAGLALVIVGENLERPASFHGKLEELLPAAAEIPGWQVAHRPLAESIEQQRSVTRNLNYDQAAFVDFTQGGTRISILVVYWSPGKMPRRLVASHTPDVCWVAGGWILRDRDRIDVRAGRDDLRMEHRIFEFKEAKEHVVFCHLVDGDVSESGPPGEVPWFAVVTDLLRSGLRQRGEQFFVRISSNRPWAEVAGTPPVRNLLRRIPTAPAGS